MHLMLVTHFKHTISGWMWFSPMCTWCSFCIEKPKGTFRLQRPGLAPEASRETDLGAKTAENNLQFWRFGKSKETLLKDYKLCTVGIDQGCRFWAEDREKKGFRDGRWWLLKKSFILLINLFFVMTRSSAFGNNKIYNVYCSANTETESLCSWCFCSSAGFADTDNKIHLETTEIFMLYLLFIFCSVWPETLSDTLKQTNFILLSVALF